MKHRILTCTNVKVLLCCAILANIGCASTASNDKDPYESFNRPVHQFNSKIDSYVAKPLSDTYKVITPKFFQKGVNNFFNNLQDINVVINDFLQAKFKQSAQDMGRFTLNSVAGLAGLVDVASTVGLDKHNEDFGQTLAVWGIPQGNYLVLPFLGPSSFRELPGYVVDTVTNPGNYLAGVAIPLAGVSALNSRANAEGSLQFINEAALDPYVFMRESYLQWRQYQADDGQAKKSQETNELENDLLGDDKEAAPKAPFATPKTDNQIEEASATKPAAAPTKKHTLKMNSLDTSAAKKKKHTVMQKQSNNPTKITLKPKP